MTQIQPDFAAIGNIVLGNAIKRLVCRSLHEFPVALIQRWIGVFSGFHIVITGSFLATAIVEGKLDSKCSRAWRAV